MIIIPIIQYLTRNKCEICINMYFDIIIYYNLATVRENDSVTNYTLCD